MARVPFPSAQALVFDLTGTCTDGHTSITLAMSRLPTLANLQASDLAGLASEWRAGFFSSILDSFARSEESPNIDTVHRRVLDDILAKHDVGSNVWSTDDRQKLVEAWHSQQPWPDTVKGLERLRKKFTIVVLANRTTRLQLDLCRDLPFNMLFSSQLLNVPKPNHNMYKKALSSMAVKPSQAIMVAAHAYDLRAAAKVGMNTMYIRRSTEDPDEDLNDVRKEVNLFIDGLNANSGLVELAHKMGC